MFTLVISSRHVPAAAMLLVVCGMLIGPTMPASASLATAALRCESRSDPRGIDTAAPRLSWQLESEQRNQRQSAYRVLVASSLEKLSLEEGDLWDSGRVTGSDSLSIVYAGRALRSGEHCYWKVQVWDQDGQASAWSRPATWEMALLRAEDWRARWVNDGKQNPERDEYFYADDPAPIFRKEFRLAKPIRQARLYVTGLGYHEARLNGARVGDQLLDPGWTAYEDRVFYSTYDVTAQLRGGTNCLGVTLGNGWWNPLPLKMWGRRNLRESLAVGRPRFIAQLVIESADGSIQRVVSDESWKVTDGPIRFNSIYLGEVYDARKELPGWDTPGFDDSTWRAAKPARERVGPLEAQPQPPIRITERIHAARVTEPQPGVFIYDLGQNFSGWASFRFHDAAGTKIVLRYGELLNPDGSLNPLTSVCGQIKGRHQNHSSSVDDPQAPEVAWQSDTYIANGLGEAVYTPRFTFHGFRYVEVTGLSKPPRLEAVEGFQLGSDVADAGEFVCSNELLNQIQQMCRRTFRANLFSVQSDCPHRERFGYGGDIVATSEALMLNFDMANFYAKTVRDWSDAARPGGMLTDTAPFVGIQYCGVGWAMAHPLLVSQLHRYYGDRRLLEEQYDVAKRWLLLVAERNTSGIIPHGLSDHESLTTRPAAPMVTPLYFQCAQMLGEMASAMDATNDAARFSALADQIRVAYQSQFIDPASGRVEPGTQASQSFALYSDLVPSDLRPQALEFLVDDIRNEHHGHLSTGIMGTKFMLDVLSRNGHAETAYDIVTKTNFPGWGWMLANGATTLWEHWALSTNTYTHNHPMFGSVSQWLIQWLGGIQPAPDAVGFDRIMIRPQTVPDLDWVRCSYNSVRGPIVSNWRREGGRVHFEIGVPANTTAEIHLPAKAANQVFESGQPVAEAGGVDILRVGNGATVIAAGSGQYFFEVPEHLIPHEENNLRMR